MKILTSQEHTCLETFHIGAKVFPASYGASKLNLTRNSFSPKQVVCSANTFRVFGFKFIERANVSLELLNTQNISPLNQQRLDAEIREARKYIVHPIIPKPCHQFEVKFPLVVCVEFILIALFLTALNPIYNTWLPLAYSVYFIF